MADRQYYVVTIRIGKDGTQYLRIREMPPARSQSARHWVSTLTENLNLLKAGFHKAFRFVSRRT